MVGVGCGMPRRTISFQAVQEFSILVLRRIENALIRRETGEGFALRECI
jgi:hypothetical protein